MREGIPFGDYWLLGRLNSGGMAEVFLGKRTRGEGAGRLLAIKRMLPRLSVDPQFVEMFNDEARIANGLKHPNICQIFDQGQLEDTLFIAMEFIHGKDLKVVHRRAKQRGDPIPPRHTAYICSRMAMALDYAHNKTNDAGEPEHIVHRDISPQNILISYDGTPKLIDFGIAKAKDRIAKTNVGVVKGKFVYMSPEQATGQTVDGRTDLFALGVVMYELVAGRLPFKGSSDFSTLKKIANASHLPIEQLAPDVPRRLGGIITRALARDPDARYATGADLAADLDRYLADERKEVTDATISSFMRRLFRDDYIGEGGRIRDFLNFEPPANAGAPTAAKPAKPAPEPAARAAPTRPGTDDGETNVTEDSQSRILAAGYDSTVISDIKKVTRTGGITSDGSEEMEDEPPAAAPSADAAARTPFFPAAPEPIAAAPAPAPAPAAAAAAAPATDAASSHFGAKTVEVQLPPVLLEGQAAAAEGMGRVRMHTQEIDDAVDSVLELEEDGVTHTTSVVSEITDLDAGEGATPERRDTDEADEEMGIGWDVEGGTREMGASEVGSILAEAERLNLGGPGPDPAALQRRTDPDQPAIDSHAELSRTTEPDRPALEPASDRPEPTLTTPTDLDVTFEGDTGSDLLLTDEDVQMEKPEPAETFDEFDIDIDDDEGETLALSGLTVGRDASLSDIDPTLPPSAPTPVHPVSQLSTGAPSHRTFTGGELALLLFALVLGVASVLGAYWYASTQPIELTPTTTTPQPIPPSAPDR